MLILTLRNFLAPYRGLVGLVLIFSLIGTGASLYLPSLNAAIIDEGVAKGDAAFIWRIGSFMLVVALVQGSCAVASVYFGAKAAASLGRDIRMSLFARVNDLSELEFSLFGAASLITRATNDIQQVQTLVLTSCTLLVSAPITMVGGVIMAIRENAGLSWLLIAAVPILAVSLGILIFKMNPLFRLQQVLIDAMNRVLREQIIGIRVVRAFTREPEEERRFAIANLDLARTATSLGALIAAIFPVVSLLMNGSSVAVLWLGAERIADGHMQIGSLTAFLTYLIQILGAVIMATFMLMQAPRAAVCADRIQQVLQTVPSIQSSARPSLPVRGKPSVRMQDAAFSYPGASAPVVSALTFRAEAGKTVGIIGSTGSGKSTLIALVPRMFDVTRGQVLVNGVDVRQLDQDVLSGQIGFVPQKAFLFSGTVASNLRVGNRLASDEEMWHALEVAQAADFVREMDGGLAASIAQGGTNVSGGQRQRLAIARALVRKPNIYIFDDCFSALDMATDARLRAALARETRQAVVMIVSQRLATIKDADQILVLEDGAIVGAGTHQELLETCRTYAEIVDSQLSAEEAAA